ncbi:MAG: NAD(P)/FAD-dependent oxidoreductase [Hyphomicrobiales bacterium]
MAETLTPDLCVIGAGSGGLSVAAAAAQLGQRVVLIERHKMGGDCLNYGCVPSKAMIAAARRAHLMRTSEKFGVSGAAPRVDHARLHDHIHGVIAAIQPNDSIERFTGLGVRVISDNARFTDASTVAAGEVLIKARRTVIATGSSPALPPIEGLDAVPCFTNETIFDNKMLLSHLLVIGGGPIGLELAQAHRRLGSKVTVLEAATPLGRDDPEMSGIVLQSLARDGVEILAGIRIERVEKSAAGIAAHLLVDGRPRKVEGTHLLVAAGRRPNVDSLDLEAGGIAYDARGIKVDRRMRTSNRKVYAIGDVAGGLQFTHVANYHAGLVIRHALFRQPVRNDTSAIPWVTFTDPELAHVGMTERQAIGKHGRGTRVLRWPYAENDRAQAERATEGFIKVVTASNGRILGAAIVGENAGDLIQIWAFAIGRKMKIREMTSMVVAYPTLAEISKRVAYTYYLPSLTNPWIRRIIRILKLFG